MVIIRTHRKDRRLKKIFRRRTFWFGYFDLEPINIWTDVEKTYRVGVAVGFDQLCVPSGNFHVRSGGDTAKKWRERDAQQPGHRRQLVFAFSDNLARPVVQKMNVAQKQHRGEHSYHVHEGNAEETFENRKISTEFR